MIILSEIENIKSFKENKKPIQYSNSHLITP